MTHPDPMTDPATRVVFEEMNRDPGKFYPMETCALAVMATWGFTYITGGSWTKRTPLSKAAFGTGYVLRSSTEPYLVGRLGAPQIHSRSERNLIEAAEIPDGIESLRREHSRKPPEMREMIERLLPRAHCAELFAREPWPGHDVWGNQVERFEVST